MNHSPPLNGNKGSLVKLALGALGVVYGDIGTSPLYAVQVCFSHGLKADPGNVLGIISLIFWGLMFIVTLKYVFIVMRADNRGEGGILALTALALSGARRRGVGASAITLIGLGGAALFFGDSLITPAISVLSAVEGLKVVTPDLEPFVLLATMLLLLFLFLFQSRGTGFVGRLFGPVMVIWFGVLAVLGLRAIFLAPEVLNAINPIYAINVLFDNGWVALGILGAVLLAFTGAEALYADMGHFGLKPIRAAWFGMVMPALLINYFGQGALLLAHPDMSYNPFYLMVPAQFTLPMVILATLATIIASQAVISGTYSLIHQAMQLDYLPRFTIRHTSAQEAGQIYVPEMNWLLCFGVLLLVMMFRSSEALAEAYGFAVVGTMLMTTLLVIGVMRDVWHWPMLFMALLLGPFLVIDLTLFATAASKVPQGGWLPLLVGLTIFMVFVTWRQGREIVRFARRNKARRLDSFIETITVDRPYRVSGTAIYLSSIKSIMPQALVSNLHHNKVLHKRVIVLTVKTEEEPRVPENRRLSSRPLGRGFWQVVLHYGFMDRPDVVTDLQNLLPPECRLELEDTSFFIGHDKYVVGKHPLKPGWREGLFLWLSNHAVEAFEYFRIPPERVVELGVQIEV